MMKLKFYIVFTVVILVIVSACETNSIWQNYGGFKMDYDSEFEHYIILDKKDTILKDYPYYNHGAILYFRINDVSTDTLFVSNGGTVIETYIDDVVFNDIFILVDQKPLEKICTIDNPEDKNRPPISRKRPLVNFNTFLSN